MSRFEGLIQTTSVRNLDDACQWLGSMPSWKDVSSGNDNRRRRHCESVDGVVAAALFDYRVFKTGSAQSTLEALGGAKTIVISLQISRPRFVGRLDDMFGVAFGFATWDPDCNLDFRLDDGNDGVFIRRDGRYLINPDEFYAKSLAEFLKFSFDCADPPCRELTRTGWGQERVLHSLVGEQTDAPKPPNAGLPNGKSDAAAG